MQKKAIHLATGDVLTGHGQDETFPPSLYAGTIRSLVVVDSGVQITLADGGTFIRPEDALLEVEGEST